MSAILGMLGLLRRTELTVRQADYAGKAERAARSLLGLLNEILDFSKIEAGKMTLEPQVFRVDHLLRDLSVILSANLNNQQVARELLEDEGALVQIANHGQEAIEAIAAADPPFDVVLMDLQMPVMDGFTATSRIRQDLGLQTLPIVAMTANAMASDREACLAVGMNEHVGKPFDIDHLVAVLCKQAGRQEAPKNTVDVGSEPRRREAIQIAVDTGKPTLSAAIKLVQQNGDTPGALLFIPMYRRGTDPTSVSQRRAALIGVVYAPLVYEELLKHLAEVELE